MSAYAEGSVAYNEGYCNSENPYREGSDEYRAWDNGWHDAMDIHYESWEYSYSHP